MTFDGKRLQITATPQSDDRAMIIVRCNDRGNERLRPGMPYELRVGNDIALGLTNDRILVEGLELKLDELGGWYGFWGLRLSRLIYHSAKLAIGGAMFIIGPVTTSVSSIWDPIIFMMAVGWIIVFCGVLSL